MENSVFHCLGSKGKQRGWKIREKIFLPNPPIFFLPNWEENCGEKAALNVKLHKCPLPPTLFTNTMAVLESSKKKKTRDRELEKKKERKHFLNEGEKEIKEGRDKEIRKNVYGGRRKKKKTRESELEKMKGE